VLVNVETDEADWGRISCRHCPTSILDRCWQAPASRNGCVPDWAWHHTQLRAWVTVAA
jgi:hypothetical protein